MNGFSLFLALSGWAVVWYALKWVEKALFLKMLSRLPGMIKGEISGYFDSKGGIKSEEGKR